MFKTKTNVLREKKKKKLTRINTIYKFLFTKEQMQFHEPSHHHPRLQ